ARLANARNTEQRLTELLKRRTDKLADVLAVEEQISATRGEIERMEAERKNLDTRIDYARLDLTITEIYKAPLDTGQITTSTRLRNAVVDGCRTAWESLVGVAAFVLSGAPAILLWCALLFFPARWAWRRLRHTTGIDADPSHPTGQNATTSPR